jgi:hypothetical protein
VVKLAIDASFETDVPITVFLPFRMLPMATLNFAESRQTTGSAQISEATIEVGVLVLVLVGPLLVILLALLDEQIVPLEKK